MFNYRKRVLLNEPAPVALTPKVFDMLLFLIGRNGTIVPKEELMNALWPDTHVEESNLTQTVFLLRRRWESQREGRSACVH